MDKDLGCRVGMVLLINDFAYLSSLSWFHCFIDFLGGMKEKNFMLHYEFPGYATGDLGEFIGKLEELLLYMNNCLFCIGKPMQPPIHDASFY